MSLSQRAIAVQGFGFGQLYVAAQGFYVIPILVEPPGGGGGGVTGGSRGFVGYKKKGRKVQITVFMPDGRHDAEIDIDELPDLSVTAVLTVVENRIFGGKLKVTARET